jgi:hypothetical protein
MINHEALSIEICFADFQLRGGDSTVRRGVYGPDPGSADSTRIGDCGAGNGYAKAFFDTDSRRNRNPVCTGTISAGRRDG